MAYLDEAGLETLWSLIEDADGALKALIEKRQEVEYGSYVGTGKYNSSYPNSLKFSFAPSMLIMICSVRNDGYLNSFPSGSGKWFESVKWVKNTYSERAGIGGNGNHQGKFDAGTNTYYWYNTSSSSYQYNDSDKTYYYVVFK